MKKYLKRLICILLSLSLVLGTYAVSFATENASDSKTEGTNDNEKDDSKNLNDSKSASDIDIAIVNYLAVKTYELFENKEDYVELENIRNLIHNGININSLKDEDTHNFVIKEFLPTITNLKLDSKARLRVVEKLNEKRANAMTKGALATAEAMTSIDTSNIAGGIVGGIGAVGVGAATYIDALQSAKSENNDLKFELDQSEIKNIDGLKNQLLDYMINMSKNKGIADNQMMREDDIKEFYNAKIASTAKNKISMLEDKEKRLSSYGPYWLELSKAYYQKGLEDESDGNKGDNYFKKAIEAFEKYEKLDNSIYREGKNIEYYKFIPVYLESIAKVKGSEYVTIAEKYAKILDENLDNNEENWDSKFYLVATYEKLNEKTNNKNYLESAYKIMEKLTSRMAVQLKEKNIKINNEFGLLYNHDASVIMSIVKLRELAIKLNKSEDERILLDKDIFGPDQKLFYNIWLDSGLAFSEKNQDLYKQIKGEKDFESIETVISEVSVDTEKAKVTVWISKELLSNPYYVRFITQAKGKDSNNKYQGDDIETLSAYYKFTINDKEAADWDLSTRGCTEEGGALLIEIHFPEVLGLENKTLDINYFNEDGYGNNHKGFEYYSAKISDNE